MRRWLCRVRPPSKRARRCLPRGVTSRVTRPVRSAVAKRGTRRSLRVSSRPARAACRRVAARRMLSPSGMPPLSSADTPGGTGRGAAGAAGPAGCRRVPRPPRRSASVASGRVDGFGGLSRSLWSGSFRVRNALARSCRVHIRTAAAVDEQAGGDDTHQPERSDTMKIAVLGTGAGGRAHAAKLLSLGHEVYVGTRDSQVTLGRTEPDFMGVEPFGQWLPPPPQQHQTPCRPGPHRAHPPGRNPQDKPRPSPPPIRPHEHGNRPPHPAHHSHASAVRKHRTPRSGPRRPAPTRHDITAHPHANMSSPECPSLSPRARKRQSGDR